MSHVFTLYINSYSKYMNSDLNNKSEINWDSTSLLLYCEQDEEFGEIFELEKAFDKDLKNVLCYSASYSTIGKANALYIKLEKPLCCFVCEEEIFTQEQVDIMRSLCLLNNMGSVYYYIKNENILKEEESEKIIHNKYIIENI